MTDEFTVGKFKGEVKSRRVTKNGTTQIKQSMYVLKNGKDMTRIDIADLDNIINKGITSAAKKDGKRVRISIAAAFPTGWRVVRGLTSDYSSFDDEIEYFDMDEDDTKEFNRKAKAYVDKIRAVVVTAYVDAISK